MKRLLLTLTLLCAIHIGAQAEIRLPRLVDNGMVLQRNSEVNIWGWATPESKITISTSWDKAKYSTTTDGEGAWRATIATSDAARDQSINLSGDGSKITLADISLGEVWVCSGQSNMEMSVAGFSNQPVFDATDLLLTANKYPDVRLFLIPRATAAQPLDDCVSPTGWVKSSPESVAPFSAVATYYGRALADMLNVPIGLIQTAYGGTRIESWMRVESIKSIEGLDLTHAFNSKSERGAAQGIFNAQIAPITNYTAKGFIWYQGETNRSHPENYAKLMPVMVREWRELWGNTKMPFYYVQLAPFHYREDPMRTTLPLIIEAQYKALKSIPYSGIAATTDLGGDQSIHPGKKRKVGERLAFMALRNDYGVKGLPNDAPTYKSMLVEEDKVTISFNNITRGNSNSFAFYNAEGAIDIRGFEIAGEDQVFYRADSVKQGEGKRVSDVVISSKSVAHPVAVRYCFHNLYESGLATGYGQPVPPFRTDNW